MWCVFGIINEMELYWMVMGGLVMFVLMVFVGWFYYYKVVLKLEWF